MFLFECVVLDTWGKFPSGILSGNMYEFGEFTECFRIERKQEHFGTRYCLAQLLVNVGNISNVLGPLPFRFRNVPNILFPDDQSLKGARVITEP